MSPHDDGPSIQPILSGSGPIYGMDRLFAVNGGLNRANGRVPAAIRHRHAHLQKTADWPAAVDQAIFGRWMGAPSACSIRSKVSISTRMDRSRPARNWAKLAIRRLIGRLVSSAVSE